MYAAGYTQNSKLNETVILYGIGGSNGLPLMAVGASQLVCVRCRVREYIVRRVSVVYGKALFWGGI